MWTIVKLFLGKYWQYLAIAVIVPSLIGGFSHWRYSAGYNKSQQEYKADAVAQAEALQREKDTHTHDLAVDKQALDESTAAKNKALEQASKAPTVLTNTITKAVHDGETCTDHSIGPDFERVWNAQAEAASGSDKPVPEVHSP